MSNNEPQTNEWYSKTQTEFFKLRREGNYKVIEYAWSPKTDSGHRKIPIVHEDLEKELLKFFERYNQFPRSRVYVWNRIKKIAEYATSGKILYPHVLRATCASIFASKGLDANFLKTYMGWEHVAIADIYVHMEEKAMLKEVARIAEKW